MSLFSRGHALFTIALAAGMLAGGAAHAQGLRFPGDTPADRPALTPIIEAPAADKPAPAKPAARPGSRQPVVLDRIVAIVNAEAITARELDERAKLAMKQLAASGTTAPPKAVIERQLLERMVASFMRHYTERPVLHTRLLPGAREALALGLPSALVTNKPRTISVLVLERLGIAGSFSAVFAGGDGPLKPSPHGVLEVIRKLGVRIDHAWLIGDGPQDVLAGRAAGCFTVAVPGIADRERVLAAEPHLVVESLLDVARLARGASGAGDVTSA